MPESEKKRLLVGSGAACSLSESVEKAAKAMRMLPVKSELEELAAMASVIGQVGWMGGNPLRPYFSMPEEKPVKCGLPGCDKTTRHNGGYCCAEHCREHGRISRSRKTEARKA